MNSILKGQWIVLLVVIASFLMPAYAAGQKATEKGLPEGSELFANKKPAFTVVVPKAWATKDKSKNPACILRKAKGLLEIPSLEIAVGDKGKETKQTVAASFKDYLKKSYGATDMEVLYERDIKLKDGTPAYELEMKWQHPSILYYSYQVVVYKDKEKIWVTLTTSEKVSDELKAIPLSLSFK